MDLRRADSKDAQTIRDLINLAFRVEEFFVYGERIALEEVEQRLRTGEFVIAEEAGAAIGCVYIEPKDERGYLGLLSVAPSHQRNGLGAQLVAAGEARCRELGCRCMDLLIVNLRKELPPFYRRLGYVETGSEPFPADVATKLPCHFIKMSKPLRSTEPRS